MAPQQIVFGPFVFDCERDVLSKDGVTINVGGRGTVLLRALLNAEGAILPKAALLEAAWPGAIVEEGNLTVQIAALRKAIGDEYIVTVPRIGYRLVRAQSAGSANGAGSLPMLAVMPFVNLAGSFDDDYFADGIVEDLTTALSRFGTFSVISRGSTFIYKGQSIDGRDAAREFGVRYVLEGAVRRQDKRVRVTAKLLDAETGTHLWAEKFDGDLADIFDFQDKITDSVVGLIEPKIRVAEIERARRKRPDSLDAYDLYLQALPYINGTDTEGYTTALGLLRKAIALDPTFALALAFAAWSLEKRITWGAPPLGPDDAEECLGYARAALAADPDEPLVLAIVGFITIVVARDYDAGLRITRKAVTANPNNLLALELCGAAEALVGEREHSYEYFHRCIRLSPHSPDIFAALSGVADVELERGNFESAVEWCQRSLAVSKEWPITYWTLIPALAHLGRLDEARAALATLRSIAPGTSMSTLPFSVPHFAARSQLGIEGFIKVGLA